MLREMSSTYGRSPGGYAWAILEPFGTILMLSFGFSLMLRSPSLGSSFILFYATGYLPFNMFQTLSRVTANALTFSQALLNYPTVLWIDAVAARIFLNLLTDILVAFVLLTSIVLLSGLTITLSFGPIIAAFGSAALLGVGVGLLNGVLFGFFPAWKTIWGIITRPLFLASGVILIFEDLPPFAGNILWWNPLMHITGKMREGFYSIYSPQYISLPLVTLLSLILICYGLMLMRRYQRKLLEL